MVILPTGTGKTAVFVLPTLAMEWRTLVFSPLVALMKDQVDSLCRKGIRAAQLSSNQSDQENRSAIQRWMAGDLQLLYVAPERLRNEAFIYAMRTIAPDMVVLDEAHCLSQWSDNFRSDYCKVGDFIAQFMPKVVSVFTATCPDEVEADIRRVLALPEAHKHVFYPRRRNLDLRSDALQSDHDVSFLCKAVQGSFLVYCASIKKVESLAETIANYLGGSDEVTIYHGELPQDVKRTNQDLFMSNKVRGVVATNAFGMGIDKPDIRMVVHRDHPGSLEALMQEVGRAGRDGLQSLCMTFKDRQSTRTQEFFIESGYPPRAKIETFFKALSKARNEYGEIMLTGREMADMANMHQRHVDSIIQILNGARVIDRQKMTTKLAKIRFAGSSEDAKFRDYAEAIRHLGKETTEDFIEVDLETLAARIGVADATVRSRIRDWTKLGLLNFIPPFAGKKTVITGSLDMVDFDRIEKKGQQAYVKLEEVIRYLDLPDCDKHGYLEEYFVGQQSEH